MVKLLIEGAVFSTMTEALDEILAQSLSEADAVQIFITGVGLTFVDGINASACCQYGTVA